MADKNSQSKDNDNALGIFFGLFFIAVTICWLFIKHANHIYTYLEYGALICGAPYLLTLIVWGFDNTKPQQQFLMAILGMSLAIVAYGLAQYGFNSLSPGLIQHGNNVANGIDFWSQLTPLGRQNAGQNMTGALCLATALLVTFLMGIYTLWHCISDKTHEESLMLKKFHVFRPKNLIWLVLFLFLSSWALTSGYAFGWFASFKQVIA